MTSLSAADLALLFNEFQTVHLIYHRNANQHHSSTWWKWFNLLHRKLRALLALLFDVEQLSDAGGLSRLHSNKLHQLKFTPTRKSAHPERQIAALQSQISSLVVYMLNKLVPDCYRAFYTILETGQFITIGLALLGVLARVRAILLRVHTSTSTTKKEVPSHPVPVPSQTLPTPSKPTHADLDALIDAPSRKKHKKKRHSAKSTMDDIFGF